jgi:hypothetical protein
MSRKILVPLVALLLLAFAAYLIITRDMAASQPQSIQPSSTQNDTELAP